MVAVIGLGALSGGCSLKYAYEINRPLAEKGAIAKQCQGMDSFRTILPPRQCDKEGEVLWKVEVDPAFWDSLMHYVDELEIRAGTQEKGGP